MLGIGLLALFLASAQAAATPERSSEAARQALSSATGQMLQGDAGAALARLEPIAEAELNARDRAVRACILERFGAGSSAAPADAADPFSERAIAAYRSYWHAALTDPAGKDAAENKLEGSLRTLLDLPPTTEWPAIEAALKQRFAAEGLHALMGRTPPLLELIVWKSEAAELRQVPLPEGTHPMEVKILDDFASLGWSAFATCDRSFTGGWVGSDAIYAVRPGWKSLTDENFRISYLAHETQHFADKTKFGELESWELEYRAKLTELALAEETLPRLLDAFESNQGPDPAIPHSYANRLVLAHMRSVLEVPATVDLGTVGRASIKDAANDLLRRDSARRSVSR